MYLSRSKKKRDEEEAVEVEEHRLTKLKHLKTPPFAQLPNIKEKLAEGDVKINRNFIQKRKDFRGLLNDNVNFSTMLLKDAKKDKKFYPYVMKTPETISLKDNDSGFEMKANKHSTFFTFDVPVLSKNGNFDYNVGDFFYDMPRVKLSLQFKSSIYIHPDFDFFMFKGKFLGQPLAGATFETMFVDTTDDSNNQMRKLFNRTMGEYSYFNFLNLLVEDIIPDTEPIVNMVPNQTGPGAAAPAGKVEMRIKAKPRVLYPYIIKDIMEQQIMCQRLLTVMPATQKEMEEYENASNKIYFNSHIDIEAYKIRRSIEVKSLNLHSQEQAVNCDIRNIVTSEKIYFVELSNELQHALELGKLMESDDSFDIDVIREIHELLSMKADEYLYLVNSNINSQIDVSLRVEKQKEYIWNCIFYQNLKPVAPPPTHTLQRYKTLTAWYSTMTPMFGFSKQEIQNLYYDIVWEIARLHKKLSINKTFTDIVGMAKKDLADQVAAKKAVNTTSK